MSNDARSYYVYALKDPRCNPARPFYIGKGTGIRAWEHELSVDNTRKGKRIKDIQESGLNILISKLVDKLTETEALKIEAELISAFGTESTGGLLTNSVIPQGINNKAYVSRINVPAGLQEKAQMALSLLKDSVLELANANENGVTNSEIVRSLGLQSDYKGGSKDYLSWSILGILMREGKLKRVENKRHKAVVR
jgi:hypothetical protein